MAKRWVINASPLIVLAKIGQIGLLTTLANEIVIPDAVVREINAGPPNDPARNWLVEPKVPIIANLNLPAELLAWDLGAGETAVLAHALANPGWTAVLDDNAARNSARSFSIPVKGTLAIVVLAKQQGLVPSAADLIRQMQQHGYRIHDAIVKEALAQTVSEQW